VVHIEEVRIVRDRVGEERKVMRRKEEKMEREEKEKWGESKVEQ
jgi:hypothetical protein